MNHVLSFANDLIYLQCTNHPFAWLMSIFGPIFYPSSYNKYIPRLNKNNRILQNEEIKTNLQNNKTNSYPTNKTIQTTDHTIHSLTNDQTSTNRHTILQTTSKTNEQQIQTTKITNTTQEKQTTTTTPTTIQTTQTTEYTTLREFPTRPPNYTFQTTDQPTYYPRRTPPLPKA